MKTAKYFDEYNEYVTGQRENINKLEDERQELSQRIKEDKEKYKDLIASSKDDEADALYSTFDKNEQKLKALQKRLETKQEVFDDARRKKAIEILKHQGELPRLYQEDKERILSKFVPIIKEFNKVIEEIEALNNEYEDEFYRYVKLYDLEDFEEDNEARDEIKNYFSPNQYSNYVGADKLPFIDTRNKLRNRGAK
ncbi:pathogenicity island protein [Staphylococcus epidermidis]|uniref:pathogenicity island protein n=1 Tax=Staphylococcus TaxID=1279 RepID=UPI000F5C9773|nr:MULTISPECIES: pathogenicity island protein [Staphylococcus]KAB2174667.1 pathogenicity island protein [Staphylococcus epidermidis]MBC2975476.1 pathogenicity island protein [Staphylococcus epidermidis]MBC3012381.1 pathogenicity island protein [Staphylococcus epidermidis]MBE7351162.1 pathogenicity island protein [Staphylococcus epidermidis]MBM6024854.1 pathogenicity island protein [Staphylococcus epidermidis]